MSSLKNLLTHRYAPAVVATLAAGAVMLYCLFLHPVGMADNGDFFRIINDQKLYSLTNVDSDHLINYFTREYGIRQYGLEYTTGFLSTHSIAIWLAVKISVLMGRSQVFDIRFLSFLYSVVFLFSFYVIVKRAMSSVDERPRLILANWIKAILFTVIFTDIGYLLYFNSFFGEAFSYVFLLLTLASIILLIGNNPRTWHMPLFLFASLMFIGAKQQNAPLGILFAIFAVRLIWIKKEQAWRTWAIAAAVIISISSYLLYSAISSDITYINQYHALTMGIQKESKAVGDDTVSMGLPRQFALLRNSIYYEGYPVIMPDGELMKSQFYAKYSFAKVATFYLTNPTALMKQLDNAALNGFQTRPDILGNYEKSAGKPPGAKTYFFSGWNTFKVNGFPHTQGFIVIFLALIYIFVFIKYYFSFRKSDIRGQLECESVVLLGIMGISQVLLAFIGAGAADLAKHLFLFDVAFDLLFVLLFTSIIEYLFVGKIEFLSLDR